MASRKSSNRPLPKLGDEDREPETPDAPRTLRDLDDAEDSGTKLPSLAEEADGTSTDKTAMVDDRSVRSGARPTLTALTGMSAGMAFPLVRPMTIFGRGKDVDVALRDAGVSRRHIRVVVHGNACVVEDLGSTNGMRINGKKEKTRELRAGDRVQIGPDVVLQFAYLDDTEENLTKQLYTAATRDALTQALNRRAFDDRFVAELSYAKRHATGLSVILLDIDHFKKVNDTVGHAGGDLVLREAANTIRRTIRNEDVFARYGGEEFVLLVRGSTEGALLLAERIREAIKLSELDWEGRSLRVTISAGVANLTDFKADVTSDELLKAADGRLYQAKAAGRDRVISK